MKDMQQHDSRRDVVDLANEEDIDVWTSSLGVSRADLERAIAAVGPSAGDVYDFIARDRMNGAARKH
jgi:hypothetical protein